MQKRSEFFEFLFKYAMKAYSFSGEKLYAFLCWQVSGSLFPKFYGGDLVMACFLVSAAEAAIVMVAVRTVKKTEKSSTEMDVQHIPFSRKLKWLSNMLWGGSTLLAYEHVWHGEVVPWFPFLTAANDPGDTAEMLHEMSTTGVTMALIVTVVWIGMVLVTNVMEKHAFPLSMGNTLRKAAE